VCFSPDGARILTGSEDLTTRVWDTRTGTPLLELKGHTATVQSVCFSPNGVQIATASADQTVRVCDAPVIRPVIELKGHKSPVRGVSYSPDGTRIVTGSEDRTARVWDTHTGTVQLELTGHTGPVQFVDFAPDGTRIVTRGFDRKVKVWDAKTGKELQDEPPPASSRRGQLSPDGAFFAHPQGDVVVLVPLTLSAGEREHRLLQTRTDSRHFTVGYEAARKANSPFAARFFLDRLIEFSMATNRPDEAQKWRAEREKYPNTAPPPREKQ
jgi:WD40 repeat protein